MDTLTLYLRRQVGKKVIEVPFMIDVKELESDCFGIGFRLAHEYDRMKMRMELEGSPPLKYQRHGNKIVVHEAPLNHPTPKTKVITFRVARPD